MSRMQGLVTGRTSAACSGDERGSSEAGRTYERKKKKAYSTASLGEGDKGRTKTNRRGVEEQATTPFLEKRKERIRAEEVDRESGPEVESITIESRRPGSRAITEENERERQKPLQKKAQIWGEKKKESYSRQET